MRAWWYSLTVSDRLLLIVAVAFLIGGAFGWVTAPYAVVPR